MATVAIGIGANLGDREATIARAIELLRAHPEVRHVRVSDLVETDPVGIVDQPRFLNGALVLETTLGAAALLKVLQSIEADAGRVRTVRNGPRTLDLDLLLYEDLVVREEAMTVPHPRMHERVFVLGPLASIAPGLRHPVLGRSVVELLLDLGGGPGDETPGRSAS